MSHTAVFSWTVGGTKMITVTVSNGCATITRTHLITICQPLTSVSIAGPVSGTVDTAYAFTATVAPPAATTPITYTWSPTPDSGQGTAIARFSWAVTGTQTISVTVSNCGGAATAEAEHQIAIGVVPEEPLLHLYLPLVLRNYP